MDNASLVVVGLGLSFIASLGVLALYQNVKRKNKPVVNQEKKQPKKKRK